MSRHVRPIVDSPFLRALPPRMRDEVVAVARPRWFEPDELLVEAGAASDSMHVVQQGHVAVEASSPQGVVLLVVLGAGEVFGELSLVDGSARRSASVRALDRVGTLEIRRELFDGLRQRHPVVDRFVAALLAARVRRLSEQLFEAHHVPAEQRIARRVFALANLYRSDGMPLDVPLTQAQLAQLSGSTRPTVNRVLRALEQEGAVSLKRGRLLVLDSEAVRRRGVGPA